MKKIIELEIASQAVKCGQGQGADALFSSRDLWVRLRSFLDNEVELERWQNKRLSRKNMTHNISRRR